MENERWAVSPAQGECPYPLWSTFAGRFQVSVIEQARHPFKVTLHSQTRPSRRDLTLVVALLLLIQAVMGNLDGSLRQMHPPEGVSGTVVDIANPLTDDTHAEALVRSWRAWDEHRRTLETQQADPDNGSHAGSEAATSETTQPSPEALINWWLLFDTAFAFVLAGLLTLLARRRSWNPGTWKTWLNAVPQLALGYLAFDLIENLLTAIEIYHAWGHPLVRTVSGLKFVLVALAALPILGSFLVRPQADRERAPSLRDQISRLGMPVAASVMFAGAMLALPSSVRPQLDDIMRSWQSGDDPSAWLWAFGGVTTLAAAIWAVGVVVLATDRTPRRTDDEKTKYGFAYIAVGLAVCAAGYAAKWQWDVLWPTTGAIGATLTVGGASLILLTPLSDERPNGDAVACRRFLAGLIAVPFFVLGLAYLRAADIALGWPARWKAAAIVLLTMAVSATLLFRWPLGAEHNTSTSPTVKYARWVWALLAVGTFACGGWAFVSPIEAGRRIGSIGLFAMWTTSLLTVLGCGQLLFRRPPNGLLRLLNIRRVPIAWMALALFASVGILDTSVGYHRVRLEPPLVTSVERSNFSQPHSAASLDDIAKLVSDSGMDGWTPLFVVASSGGGARSAFWTSLVLNCLFTDTLQVIGGETADPCPADSLAWDSVAMASGISGGSVGLAMFWALQHKGDGDAKALPSSKIFDDGFVDPVIARLLFTDLPNSLFRFNGPGHDRASILEEAWEGKADGMDEDMFGSGVLPDGTPRLPVLLMNSASIRDGCRVNVSVVGLAPHRLDEDDRDREGLTSCRAPDVPVAPDLPADTALRRPLASTRDIQDFVCENQQMNLSTAALLSARFPIVSPTGALQECPPVSNEGGQTESKSESKPDFVFLGDGGYVDSSAASPLVELLPQLVDLTESHQPTSCVQPIVLQIDNGYVDQVATARASRPPEVIAPIIGAGSAQAARADAHRQSLELASTARSCFEDARGLNQQTYFHVYPDKGVGVEAPLGWSLSQDSQENLFSQLQSNNNRSELCALAELLTTQKRPCQDLPLATYVDVDNRLRTGSWFVWLLVLVSIAALATWWLWGRRLRERQRGRRCSNPS